MYKKLAGQTIIYGLGTVLPRLLNYSILTVYYTRLFSVEQFGVITELYAYVTFLLIILTYGMETGYFRFSVDKNSDVAYSSIIISLFTTSIVFLFTVLFLRNSIATALDYGNQANLISMIAAIVAIDAFCAVPFAKLRKEERGLKFSILKIISVVVTIVCVVFFYEILPGLAVKYSLNSFINIRADVSYVLLANLIASLIVLLFLLPEVLKTKPYFDWKLLRNILNYSFPLLIAGLAGTINETLDRVLLKHLIVDKEKALFALGIYGANFKIATLLAIFIQMFRYAVEPFYFNYFGKKDDKIIFSQVMRLFIGVILILCLIILLYLNYIKYFISPKFHEGLFIVPIILLSYLFYGIVINLSIWYKLTKQTIYGAIITIIGAVVTIGINVVFVKKYSYAASAWGHILSYVVMVVVSYILGQRFFRIDYKIGRIAEYIFIAIAIFAINKYLVPQIFIITDLLSALLIIGYTYYIVRREKVFSLKKILQWK